VQAEVVFDQADVCTMECEVVSGTENNPTMTVRAAGFAYKMRRRIATVAAVIVAIFFGYHAIFGQNGVNAYQQKRMEDRDLKKQIEVLSQENTRLQTHVDHLKNDPDAIEHEARERLHYARPGEVIWTLNDKPAEAAVPVPAKK
jgi:cell division protein FtsB